MPLAEVYMKRPIFIVLLAIALAGGALGALSAPSDAQVYGYVYPAPPPKPVANPWVGPNTPWVFYQGDWFLNGILYHFFGPKYGWAPYYAYPPVYIVRPTVWYAPKWHTWYKHNPHYWQTFKQHHPYWAGHRVGTRYDQNFYNKHHHGHGSGWHQGFQGVRPPGPAVPGVRPPAVAPGHHGRPAGAPAPAVREPRANGPGGPPPGSGAPGVRGNGAHGPAIPPKPAGPEVREPAANGAGYHKPGSAGPDAGPRAGNNARGRGPGAAGPGGPGPAPGSDRTPRGEPRPQ